MISNDIILPSPIDVFMRLIELMGDIKFYINLLSTFIRAHLAFVLSLGLGLILALLSIRFKTFESIFSIWIKWLQTIPQISFIIPLYFWLDKEWCLYVVVMLLGFPIIYFNYLEAFASLPKEYLDEIEMTQHTFMDKVRYVYLPLCYPTFKACVEAVLPLCLKVTIMSEVLIYTSLGIGRELSLAKSGIDTLSVFALTLITCGLISVEMNLIQSYFKKAR